MLFGLRVIIMDPCDHPTCNRLTQPFKMVAILVLFITLAACSTYDGLKSDIKRIIPGGDDNAEASSLALIDEEAPTPQTSEQPSGDTLVTQIQEKLAALGYNPGKINGETNTKTEAAIQDFQLDNDLVIDGRPSKSLLRLISEKTEAN